MDRQAVKNSLKGRLPRGFTSTIKSRLHEKGISIGLSMISRVCDAEKPNWNNDIIVEALKLAAEEVSTQKDIQQQAAAL